MDVIRIGSALARMWYVVLVGVLGALAVGALAYFSTSASYVSTAKVSLMPPNLSTLTQPSNPLLELDNNLAQTASVVADVLGADGVRQEVAAVAGGTYEVSNVKLRSEVFTGTISISATAGSAAGAQATAQTVVDLLVTRLQELQKRAGVVDNSTLIKPAITVPPSSGRAVHAGSIKAAAGAAVAVFGLAILLTLALDTLRQRRRARKARKAFGTDARDGEYYDRYDDADKATDLEEAPDTRPGRRRERA